MATLNRKTNDASRYDLTVFTCGDGRLNGDRGLHARLKARFGTEGQPFTWDTVRRPGACFCFKRHSPFSWQEAIAEIAMYLDLHRAETIAVIQHTDCGMYRRIGFPSEGAEHRCLTDDMRYAAVKIWQAFPSVRIVGLIARVDGEGVIGLDETVLNMEEIAAAIRDAECDMTRERANA